MRHMPAGKGKKGLLQHFDPQQPLYCFHLQNKYIAPWQGALYTVNDEKVQVGVVG